MEKHTLLAYLDGCYDTGDETPPPPRPLSVNGKRIARLKGMSTGRTHLDSYSSSSGINRSSQKASVAVVREKKVRREIANSNERKRMQSINDGFQCLRVLLPQTDAIDKLSKAAILQQACNYINALLDDRRRLLEMNARCIVKLRQLASATPPPSPTGSVRRKWSVDSATDESMEFGVHDCDKELELDTSSKSVAVKMEDDVAPDYIRNINHDGDEMNTESHLQSSMAQTSDRITSKRKHEKSVWYSETPASTSHLSDSIKKVVEGPSSDSIPCILVAEGSNPVVSHDHNRLWSSFNTLPGYTTTVQSPSYPVLSTDCSLSRQNLNLLFMASRHIDGGGEYFLSESEMLAKNATVTRSVDSDGSCEGTEGDEFYDDNLRGQEQTLRRHRKAEQLRRKSSNNEELYRDGDDVVIGNLSAIRQENKPTLAVKISQQLCPTGSKDRNFCARGCIQDCQCSQLRREIDTSFRASIAEHLRVDVTL